MTAKKQTVEATAVEQKLAQTDTPEVNEGDRWVRQTALELALQFHKNNGGMMNPMQLLGNAQQFLDFIKGEAQ